VPGSTPGPATDGTANALPGKDAAVTAQTPPARGRSTHCSGGFATEHVLPGAQANGGTSTSPVRRRSVTSRFDPPRPDRRGVARPAGRPNVTGPTCTACPP
jgi:hypothetical protein